MRRNAKLTLVAVVGAAAGVLFSRWRRPAEPPPAPADQRAEELRHKLAEARAATADEDDFDAAGMGAETVVAEPPRPEPAIPADPSPDPSVEEQVDEPSPPEQPKQEKKPTASERPPSDEFEAMRRRIHEEGRSAAEEMRRSGEPPEPT